MDVEVTLNKLYVHSYNYALPYSKKLWQSKSLAKGLLQGIGEKNFGEC